MLQKNQAVDEKILNIEDRQSDYQELNKLSWRAENGIRAICVMYDDHSSDRNSNENIFIIKDNVHYRLFSLVHQYLIFLRELANSEGYLKNLHTKDPRMLTAFPLGNPHFDKVELEISSVFDSIVFQLSSLFDYLSHMICYICKTDKSRTLYWTKLASSVHGQNNEFSALAIKEIISEIDKSFVGKLYDYRSRLLHNKKDRHIFSTTVKLVGFDFDVKVLASDLALNYFKLIRKQHPDERITLAFLSSWLIRQSFTNIETILDALREEILKTSSFHLNLIKPKKPGFMTITMDPKTKFAKPASDMLWEQYKQKK